VPEGEVCVGSVAANTYLTFSVSGTVQGMYECTAHCNEPRTISPRERVGCACGEAALHTPPARGGVCGAKAPHTPIGEAST
jgi:hypothetical protein